MDNLTAKVSCFARAYHFKNNQTHIFADSAAEQLLGNEYEEIKENMTNGIGFFLPGFDKTKEEGLRLIVNQQLSPSVLGRSAFCENLLEEEKIKGCEQYVLFAAGYDTYGIRNRDKTLAVYELDLPELISDKMEKIHDSGLETNAVFVPCNLADITWKEKLLQAGFLPDKKSFGSLLGISYYLSKKEFELLLRGISELLSKDSAICFDFPTKEESRGAEVNRQLAQGAGEAMKAMYTFAEIEDLLSKCGYEKCICLNHDEATNRYFTFYNAHANSRMEAPAGVGYVLARRR